MIKNLSNEQDDMNLTFPYTCTASSSKQMKALEMYIFIDPLCVDCWSLEPIIEKLQLQYGKYFVLRKLVFGKLERLNHCQFYDKDKQLQKWKDAIQTTGTTCEMNTWEQIYLPTPFYASLSYKAAELQGKKYGLLYLRKLQEAFFLLQKDISTPAVLIECAQKIGLDMDEFKKDFHSTAVFKSLQEDLAVSCEMNIKELPTIVILSNNPQRDGTKIDNVQPYEVYEKVISNYINFCNPNTLPTLKEYVQNHSIVTTAEISQLYNLPHYEVEKEMKKLQLCDLVEHHPLQKGSYWKCKNED